MHKMPYNAENMPIHAIVFQTINLGISTLRDCTKKNEFSEKFQTAFDPPPPHFRKVMLQFFLTGYASYQFYGQIALFKGPNFANINFGGGRHP